MQQSRDGAGPAAPPFSPRGRVVITVLVLLLPLACLALAMTSRTDDAEAWYLFAVANLVLPAVILPIVWRGARSGGTDRAGTDRAGAAGGDPAPVGSRSRSEAVPGR